MGPAIVVPAAVIADCGPPQPKPWAPDMLLKALKGLKSLLLSRLLGGRMVLLFAPAATAGPAIRSSLFLGAPIPAGATAWFVVVVAAPAFAAAA